MILSTNVIGCELKFDPIFGELEGAGHDPCIVSERQGPRSGSGLVQFA